MSRYRSWLIALVCLCPVASARDLQGTGGDTSVETSPESLVEAGHSYHGEAFNEGPRQSASLVDGLAKINFPTSSKNETAQKFFEQGIAWLHGFAYLEAERSFRQALQEDPDLIMAYWGMAMANTNNSDRARGMIDEAKERLGKKSDKRERLYIEALDRYLPKSKDEADTEANTDKNDSKPDTKTEDADAKRKRTERFIADFENILYEFPDDIEAKAFLVLQMWLGERVGVKITSRLAVDALMSEIFAADPMHPAHHYRIHLWDRARAKLALESAAQCGPSMPGVAHMWHMPGHIYSKLHRYADAAWQQEASARVDHAYMNRARLLPDQIHNFAHNNEWLTRNLLYLGRVGEAIQQSKNLLSLPRHPKYNSLEKRGSYQYGRKRLLQAYTEFGLWEELINESDTAYLPSQDLLLDSLFDKSITSNSHRIKLETEPVSVDIEESSAAVKQSDIKLAQADEDWLGWLAAASFKVGKPVNGAKTLRSLHRRRIALESELLDLGDARMKSAKSRGEPRQDKEAKPKDEIDTEPTRTAESIRGHLTQLRRVIARASAAAASHRQDPAKVKELSKKAKLDALITAQWTADAGDLQSALETVRRELKQRQGQVRPQAILVDLLWRNKESKEAKKQFEVLRTLAGEADLDSPLMKRVEVVAAAIPIQGDWRKKSKPADDLGERPPLESLGTARWQPYQAPTWEATTPGGTEINADEFASRPRLVVFYLGFGCLHCMEQLHALAPRVDDFAKAGIDVIAISTESPESLRDGLDSFEEPMPIPLFADGTQSVFKTYRCWDDFENQPLHGTFLIDSQDRVRWQDIGYEPFMDVDFLLNESRRLLSLPMEPAKGKNR